MRKRWLLLIPLVLLLVYWAGPHPPTPVYNTDFPPIVAPEQIDSWVAKGEALHKLRKDNEARVIWWNNDTGKKTPNAIVYLHGFSASQFEGAPTHTAIAKQFGCNLYLSRLAEHGIDTTDALVNLTPEAYWESAKEALARGLAIGEKVILMGTSTGGTNAIQLAATYPDKVAGLILLSPNIAINDPNAWILNDPWGLQLARAVTGSKERSGGDDRPQYGQYWNARYRLEATVALQEMLESTMTPATFKKVNQPLLLLYFYKNEKEQDPVVKVEAMQKMFASISTPPALKLEKAMPLTGDHVIGSPFKSKDAPGVQAAIADFMRQQMQLQPIE